MMNKNILFSLALALSIVLVSGSANAYSEQYYVETATPEKISTIGGDLWDDPYVGVVENFDRPSNVARRSSQLYFSKINRARLAESRKDRTAVDKFTYNQRFRNILGQKAINVNYVKTLINRTGELEDRSGIQQYSDNNFLRQNGRANWYRLAECYYLEGKSNCNTAEEMGAGVIFGVDQRGKRQQFMGPYMIQSRGDISLISKDPLRDMISWYKPMGAAQQSMYNGVENNSNWTAGMTQFTPIERLRMEDTGN